MMTVVKLQDGCRGGIVASSQESAAVEKRVRSAVNMHAGQMHAGLVLVDPRAGGGLGEARQDGGRVRPLSQRRIGSVDENAKAQMRRYGVGVLLLLQQPRRDPGPLRKPQDPDDGGAILLGERPLQRGPHELFLRFVGRDPLVKRTRRLKDGHDAGPGPRVQRCIEKDEAKMGLKRTDELAGLEGEDELRRASAVETENPREMTVVGLHADRAGGRDLALRAAEGKSDSFSGSSDYGKTLRIVGWGRERVIKYPMAGIQMVENIRFLFFFFSFFRFSGRTYVRFHSIQTAHPLPCLSKIPTCEKI